MSKGKHKLKGKEKELFDLLVTTATKGQRCPDNEFIQDTYGSLTISDLARKGHCRIEIYSQNYRVVTITYGEDAGIHTLLPPNLPTGTKPYRTVDSNGDSGAIRRYKAADKIKVSLPSEPDWSSSN